MRKKDRLQIYSGNIYDTIIVPQVGPMLARMEKGEVDHQKELELFINQL